MIYLDHGATSFPKPMAVRRAVMQAMERCTNPGRGGYPAAMAAQEVLYSCREQAGKLFHAEPEQVVLTTSCTHGLNIAIGTLVQPGDRVLITGFEHNAVTRPLHHMGAEAVVAGRKLFCWEDMLEDWERGLKSGVKAAVMTHVSNVFGYILPLQEMAALCRQYKVPFVVDAAQSAGVLPVDFAELGADFIAMPGHKGLLGPQGTGLLLCGRLPSPLLCGGTGSESMSYEMPDYLPDRAEAGTLNVPGFAGLAAGMELVSRMGPTDVLRRARRQVERCARGLEKLGYTVFAGKQQATTLSFLPQEDCEDFAGKLARRGIAVRAGLHCAPLAHASAGTLQTGTVRLSFGQDAADGQSDIFLREIRNLT